MNKKFYLIPLFFVVAVFAAALIVRASYTNNAADFYNYPYSSVYFANESKQNLLKDYGYKSFSDIIDKSELIVKCKMQPGRIITVGEFYTPVKVLDVYKGNKKLRGRQLQIIEYITKQVMYNELNADYGYVPLYAGNDYILCLTKRKWSRDKILSGYENSEYYVTTLSAFGMFRTVNKKQTRLFASYWPKGLLSTH